MFSPGLIPLLEDLAARGRAIAELPLDSEHAILAALEQRHGWYMASFFALMRMGDQALPATRELNAVVGLGGPANRFRGHTLAQVAVLERAVATWSTPSRRPA
ncbi:MAG: hypothetical protein JWM80_352 [Cyanobacteria bacterium RYN_339]|nr:hypothetical protein [Cyanobacteria bacterium RYN_339]